MAQTRGRRSGRDGVVEPVELHLFDDVEETLGWESMEDRVRAIPMMGVRRNKNGKRKWKGLRRR